MGEWLVDWVFGDVHARPGLSARERELIIVAVLTRDRLERSAGGGAHPRAARDRRALGGDRGDDPPDRAVRRDPARDQRAQGAADGAGAMRALRYTIGGDARLGRLGRPDGGGRRPGGAVGLRAIARGLGGARGRRRRPACSLGDVTVLYPTEPRKIMAIGLNYRDHAEESELDIPPVPVVFAKWPSSLIARGADRGSPRGEPPGLRGRGGGDPRAATSTGRTPTRPAPPSAASRSSTTSPAAARSWRRRFASSRSARASTRSRRWGRSCRTPTASTSSRIGIETRVSGEVMQSSSTANLIFSVVEIIEYLSKGMTL